MLFQRLKTAILVTAAAQYGQLRKMQQNGKNFFHHGTVISVAQWAKKITFCPLWPKLSVMGFQSQKYKKNDTKVQNFEADLGVGSRFGPMPFSLSRCPPRPQSLELLSMRTGGSSWPQVNPACPLTLPHTHYTQYSCLVGILGWKPKMVQKYHILMQIWGKAHTLNRYAGKKGRNLNFFSPQNRDFAGLMMGPKKFQLWPFWPKLYGIKVPAKFVLCRGFFSSGHPVAPLSSQPYFPKIHVHGKFQYRVSREGLGTSEMWKTKTTDEPFWRTGIWGI